METIARTKLNDFINSTNGKIFTAIFIKKDGTVRELNCRKGVTSFLRGGENKAVKPSNGYVVAFDMQKHDYRMLNLDTVSAIRFRKITYSVL